MKVFYSRISTTDQSDLRQLKNTEKGFDYVLSDKCSGSIPIWERPRGKQIKELIEEGKLKELHIHSIDRLGRNTIDVLTTYKELTDLNIRVVCRNPNLQNFNEDGTKDSFSEMMVSLLSIMSKFEKDMIDMRRTEGIERTKELHPERYSGRKIGTKDSSKKFLQKTKSINILKDIDNGYGIREISKMRDCSFNTIYKVIKLNNESKLSVSKMIKMITETQTPNWISTLSDDEKKKFVKWNWLIMEKLKMCNDIEVISSLGKLSTTLNTMKSFKKIDPQTLYNVFLENLPKGVNSYSYKKRLKKKDYDSEMLELMMKEYQDSSSNCMELMDVLEETGVLNDHKTLLNTKWGYQKVS